MKINVWIKTDDLRWDVRSEPPRPECVVALKILQKVGDGGALRGVSIK